MSTDLPEPEPEPEPERPAPPATPSPRPRARLWLALLALVLLPVALVLGWYGLAMALGVANTDSVWSLAVVLMAVGVVALIWFAEWQRIARRWTALALGGYLAATAFWAVFLFLVALGISCDADPCFN